jgi:hypothetical protein
MTILNFPKKSENDFTTLDFQLCALVDNHGMKKILLSLIIIASDEEMQLLTPSAKLLFALDNQE